MTDFLAEAQQIAPELKALRNAFHRDPELGNREYRTAARIEAYLRDLGIGTRRVTETAVVGVLRGAASGRTAALRADMDALPLEEATGADFASENPGVMHACGHDVHIAAALGAAKLLSAHRGSLPGNTVFLFQPDEEGSGGAKRMIDAGALEGVDAVFGAHVSPDLPAGSVGVRYGKFYAASDMFDVTMTGRSAHGAEREKGVDALAAAVDAVSAVLALNRGFPGERRVLTVGTICGGTAGNILADKTEFSGIIRTLGQDARMKTRALFTEAVNNAAAAYGASARIELRESYPGVVNDDDMTKLVQDAVSALLGEERVRTIPAPTMATEDFGCFLLDRPGSFYHIGAGCTLPLHNPGFLPDENAPVIAAAVHAAVLIAYITKDQ